MMSFKLIFERIWCVPGNLGTSQRIGTASGQPTLWGDPNIKMLRVHCDGLEAGGLSWCMWNKGHSASAGLLRAQHPPSYIEIIHVPATQGFGDSLKMTHGSTARTFCPMYPTNPPDGTAQRSQSSDKKEKIGEELGAVAACTESYRGRGEAGAWHRL